MMKINTRTFYISIFLFLAILIRGVFVFAVHPPEKYLYNDMHDYYRKALKLSEGRKEIIFDTFHPPGTHYLYSLFVRLPQPFFWIKIFHILAGTLTILFIYGSTKLLFGKKAALPALIFSSFNYLFIDFEGYLMSETPYILGLASMFYFLLKSIKVENKKQRYFYSFLTGLAIAVSASFKATIILFVPFLGLWGLMNFRKYKLARNFIFYSFGFLPLYFLMMMRVFFLTGHWGDIATCGGVTFYENKVRTGRLTFYDTKYNPEHYWFASPVNAEKGYSLIKHFNVGPYESGFFYREGLKEVRRNIPRAISQSLENFYDLFYSTTIWPTRDIGGILPKIIKYFNIAFVYTIVFPVFVFFFLRFKRMIRGLKILPCLVILVVILQAIVFVGDPRHRVPFDIFFIILSGYLYAVALPVAFASYVKKCRVQH